MCILINYRGLLLHLTNLTILKRFKFKTKDSNFFREKFQFPLCDMITDGIFTKATEPGLYKPLKVFLFSSAFSQTHKTGNIDIRGFFT